MVVWKPRLSDAFIIKRRQDARRRLVLFCRASILQPITVWDGTGPALRRWPCFGDGDIASGGMTGTHGDGGRGRRETSPSPHTTSNPGGSPAQHQQAQLVRKLHRRALVFHTPYIYLETKKRSSMGCSVFIQVLPPLVLPDLTLFSKTHRGKSRQAYGAAKRNGVTPGQLVGLPIVLSAIRLHTHHGPCLGADTGRPQGCSFYFFHKKLNLKWKAGPAR